MLLLLPGISSTAHADAVWQFVDRDGVVHMGNVPTPQVPGGRELVWLGLMPRSMASPTAQHGSAVQRLPGYAAAQPHLQAAALAQALEPALVIAVAAAESAFNVQAVSRKGALGLMQVMPATAERYGVAARTSAQASASLMEPKLNAEVGSRYLADLLRLFGGDKELALAAYNAGEGAVLKYGRRIPPYPETQQYVERVMRLYRNLLP
ncbi:MAG: lytic transglycosylase domain-containing protein [Burkholderiaceae bacterium]|jgi:soluble lytic murein transglycosylase-like protein|nr:lytic transglycosylase domain-containing protein [Burkholderiaceae bacterium]